MYGWPSVKRDLFFRISCAQLNDAIGNPTTYNGYTLEWNGRKLMEMSMNVGQFLYTFAYNADGIRTVKTNGSTIHHYTLNGSQIVTDDLPKHRS